jgi:hypothetical protein
MTRVIALMALAALGLSEVPVHEPVHAGSPALCAPVTTRNTGGLMGGTIHKR